MEDRSIDDLAKVLWEYNCLHQTPEKADIIIAFGSHDLRVAQRAVELFQQSYAPTILFSGGLGRLTLGSWTQPEAEMFALTAIKMGVPEESILIENKSTNTGENIRLSMELLEQRSIVPQSVLLVHKPYMERRQYASWKKFFPQIRACVTSPKIPFEQYPNEVISKQEMINIIVGDTQRIKLYPARGYMIEQDIPQEVWSAYEELVRRGYTQQLVKE